MILVGGMFIWSARYFRYNLTIPLTNSWKIVHDVNIFYNKTNKNETTSYWNISYVFVIAWMNDSKNVLIHPDIADNKPLQTAGKEKVSNKL